MDLLYLELMQDVVINFCENMLLRQLPKVHSSFNSTACLRIRNLRWGITW